jgi:3-isopropylmalate/(R)-2-methylmalate dehydratase small subunit
VEDTKRTVITGRAVPVRGNDIDTDRIIPARYLRTVVFDGLGGHVFEDDRKQLSETGRLHPFDDPKYAQAEVLLVNQNFGCGSSREHAPQALKRWGRGIRAVVGESFAEIFYGNCAALGIPCPRLNEAAMVDLMSTVEKVPETELRVDLVAQAICVGSVSFPFEMPDGVRRAFIEGRWDSTTELMGAVDQIRATADRIPYFGDFQS